MTDYFKEVNKIARSKGDVGKNGLVPKYVREHYTPGTLILDYGAGPTAQHTFALRELGFNVDAFDVGDNWLEGVHVKDTKLRDNYDVVFASNVLNVQPTKQYVAKVLSELNDLGTIILVNYPVTPRKSDVTVDQLERLLKGEFGTVEMVVGTKAAPVYRCVY